MIIVRSQWGRYNLPRHLHQPQCGLVGSAHGFPFRRRHAPDGLTSKIKNRQPQQTQLPSQPLTGMEGLLWQNLSRCQWPWFQYPYPIHSLARCPFWKTPPASQVFGTARLRISSQVSNWFVFKFIGYPLQRHQQHLQRVENGRRLPQFFESASWLMGKNWRGNGATTSVFSRRPGQSIWRVDTYLYYTPIIPV